MRKSMVLVAAGAFLLSACGSVAATGSSGTSTGSTSSSTSSGTFYKINTANCPSPAQTLKPIKGTLTLGWSAPLSGPIAPFAEAFIQGTKDRFAYANVTSGGVNGVKLAVVSKDDQFNPALAKQNIDQFIQSGNVQVLDTFGSGQLAAVAADQNASCVPLLFEQGTQAAYRNISQYPWTTEFLPANIVEETAEVQVIKATFPGASTINVAIAEDPTGSGTSYVQGFDQAIKGTNIKVVANASLADPNQAAITLKSSGAQVLFDAGVVPECLAMTEAMAHAGWSPKLVVQTSNCGSAQLMFAPAGAAANGQKLVFWEKDPGNPLYANDPGWKVYVKDATSVDSSAAVNNTYYETGWMVADLMVNAFQNAAASKLGLSEAGIMQAARNQNYQPPLFINGIRWVMNAKEAYGLMKLQPLVYSSATQSFHYAGSAIDTCPILLGAGNCSPGL